MGIVLIGGSIIVGIFLAVLVVLSGSLGYKPHYETEEGNKENGTGSKLVKFIICATILPIIISVAWFILILVANN